MADYDLKPKRVVSVEKFEPLTNLKSSRKIVSVEKLEVPKINKSNSFQQLGNLEAKVPVNRLPSPDNPNNFKKGKPLHQLLASDVKSRIDSSEQKVVAVGIFEPRELRRHSSIGATDASKSEKGNTLNTHKKKIAKVEEFVLPSNKLRTQKSRRKMSRDPTIKAIEKADLPAHLPPLGPTPPAYNIIRAHDNSSNQSISAIALIDEHPPHIHVCKYDSSDSSNQSVVGGENDACHAHISPSTTTSVSSLKTRRANLARLNKKFTAHHPDTNCVERLSALPVLRSDSIGCGLVTMQGGENIYHTQISPEVYSQTQVHGSEETGPHKEVTTAIENQLAEGNASSYAITLSKEGAALSCLVGVDTEIVEVAMGSCTSIEFQQK